jgi:hypothetical protein
MLLKNIRAKKIWQKAIFTPITAFCAIKMSCFQEKCGFSPKIAIFSPLISENRLKYQL